MILHHSWWFPHIFTFFLIFYLCLSISLVFFLLFLCHEQRRRHQLPSKDATPFKKNLTLLCISNQLPTYIFKAPIHTHRSNRLFKFSPLRSTFLFLFITWDKILIFLERLAARRPPIHSNFMHVDPHAFFHKCYPQVMNVYFLLVSFSPQVPCLLL